MPSPQTLGLLERRLVAAWAADCVADVLHLHESAAPDDDRPQALVERARAFSRGELDTATEIRRRFRGGVPAGDAPTPAAAAVARAAGQAVGVCHMGAHALGAAAYAVCAVVRAKPDDPRAAQAQVDRLVALASPEARAALVTLPPVGADAAGPLAPGGLLDRGDVGAAVRALQAALADTMTAG